MGSQEWVTGQNNPTFVGDPEFESLLLFALTTPFKIKRTKKLRRISAAGKNTPTRNRTWTFGSGNRCNIRFTMGAS